MTKKRAFIILVFLSAVYLYLTFGFPPDPRTLALYKLTVAKSRLLSLSVAAPLLVIWFFAFYGFAQFKEYANKISKSADGKALNKIANGLMLLGLSLPISSILSSSLNLYARTHPEFRKNIVFITGYYNIIVYALVFWLILKGSRMLLRVAKKKLEAGDLILPIFGFATNAGLFTYLTLKNHWLFPKVPVSLVHYINTPLVVLGFIMPYLIIWLMGLLSVAKITLYRQTVEGSIYKSMLNYFNAGIGMIIATSILVQFLGATGPALLRMSLTQLLWIVYALLAIIAAGYILIAKGAQKLSKLEEV